MSAVKDSLFKMYEDQNKFILWLYACLPIGVYFLRKWIKGPTTGTDNPKLLNDRIVVVTGGNSGIGKETSKNLARRGAKVYILCRNTAEGQKVADRISSSYPKCPHPEVLALDLTSLDSVKACAEKLLSTLERIDILVNNAGVMLTGPEKTQDGFDLQFGTNHLGHFLLTELLLPLLKRSAQFGHEPRIVNVSSRAYRRCQGLNWADLNFQRPGTFNSLQAYAQSKLANILHAKKLSRDLSPYGIKAYSLHPGVVASTNLDRHLKVRYPIFYILYYITVRPVVRFMMKNNLDGAQTTLFCALDDSLKTKSGSYCSDCRIGEKIELAENIEDQDLLDKLSRKFVNL